MTSPNSESGGKDCACVTEDARALTRIANLADAERREAMYREADPAQACFVCSGTREHPRDADAPCPNCADDAACVTEVSRHG